MDVPLALNNIGIRFGFKGYRIKSSAFSHQAGVEDLRYHLRRLVRELSLTFSTDVDRKGVGVYILKIRVTLI